MNIFMLDKSPTMAAQAHCDKHVVKMILEYAQLLSTAHRLLDGDDNVPSVLYKATHKNHPSAIWTRESAANYHWLYNCFVSLCDEYTSRYGKTHATDTKLRHVLKDIPQAIPSIGLTQLRLAMPDEYKKACPVESYRAYYKAEKADIAKWKQNQPEWWTA